MILCYFAYFSFSTANFELSYDSLYSPKKILPLDPTKYFPICNSTETKINNRKFGEVLAGENLGKIGNNLSCANDFSVTYSCQKQFTEKEVQNIQFAIKNEYRAGFSLAGLPIASYSKGQFRYQHVPIGFQEGPDFLIRTKFSFLYTCDPNNNNNPVFVFDSISFSDSFSILKPNSIISYSYTIYSTNPDQYLAIKQSRTNRDPEFHMNRKNLNIYYAISLVASAFCFITGILTYVENRSTSDTDNSTISKGLDFEFDDTNGFDEIGWRLLHGDVFRSPSNNIFFCALIGCGLEFALTLFIVYFLAYLNFIEIVSFASFVEPFVVVYFFTAPFNGFLSMKLFKTIGRQFWKRNLLVSGTFSSIFFLVCFIILQFSFLSEQSSANVSIKYFLKTSVVVFGGSFFFHVLGSIPALKSAAFSKPTEVNQLPRHIPKQPKSSSVWLAAFLGGFVVFILIALNYHMLLESLWTGMSFYNLFGSGTISLIYAFLASCGVSILAVYTMLSSEDYRWWWRAFIAPASCGIYTFIYGIGYAIMSSKPTFSLLIPYIVESLLFSFVIGLACGCIGFFGAFVFVRLLYDSLKME